MRIVSLNCSNTEIVCALGHADSLVGVDNHSDYPEDVVAPLPRVGPDLEIDVAKVLALEPDIVLASLTVPGHEKIVAQLESAGLNFIAPEPTSLVDVRRDILAIGAAIGAQQTAVTVADEFAAAVGLTDGAAGPTPAGAPTILVQWWPKPVIAPGAMSWVDGLLAAAGARNPLGDEAIKSRPITDDEVAAINPDAVVISWCGVKPKKYRPDVVYRNPVWSELDFVTNQRVFCVPEAWLGRPSQRLAAGRRALGKIVDDLAQAD